MAGPLRSIPHELTDGYRRVDLLLSCNVWFAMEAASVIAGLCASGMGGLRLPGEESPMIATFAHPKGHRSGIELRPAMGGRSIMRSHVRVLLAAPLIGAILALVAISAPAAQAAFGVESFFAANCKTEACTLKSTLEHPSEYFTQAAGHPPAGITEFVVKHEEKRRSDLPRRLSGGQRQGNTHGCRAWSEHKSRGGRKVFCQKNSHRHWSNQKRVFI